MRSASVAFFGLALVCGGPSVGSAEPPSGTPVAFIEHVYPSAARLRDVISIVRKGRPVAVSENANLFAGDRIYVLNAADIVTVRMVATRALLPVRQHHGSRPGEPDLEVPGSAVPGLLDKAFEFMKLASLSADQSRGDTAALSRDAGGSCFNAGGKTNEPLAFAVPALAAERSYLSPGIRRLFVSWRGGTPPFTVVLAEAATGKPLAQVQGVQDRCGALLPAASIVAGDQYTLAVIDGNSIREEDVDIFGSAAAPPIPVQIEGTVIPEDARRIYFATWLTMQDSGAWTFEAEQRVVAMNCEASAPAREWLASFGVKDCTLS